MWRYLAVLAVVLTACGGDDGAEAVGDPTPDIEFPVPEGSTLVLDMDDQGQHWDTTASVEEVDAFYAGELDGWDSDLAELPEDVRAMGFTGTYDGGEVVVGAVEGGQRIMVTFSP